MRAVEGVELSVSDPRLAGKCLDTGAMVNVADEGEIWRCLVIANWKGSVRLLPMRLVRGVIESTTTEDERVNWQRVAFTELGRR